MISLLFQLSSIKKHIENKYKAQEEYKKEVCDDSDTLDTTQ